MLGVCVCYFQVSSLKKNNTKQPLFIFFIFLSFGMVSGIQPSDFVFSFLPSQQAKLCRGNTRQRMQDLLGARAQQSLCYPSRSSSQQHGQTKLETSR